MTRQLLKFGAAVMTTFLALAVMWQFRIVVIYALISLMLAATLRPLVKPLIKRSFMVRVGWVLLYLAAAGGFVFLLFLTGEVAIKEIQQLAQSVSVQDEWRLPIWLHSPWLQETLITMLPAPSKLFEAVTGEQGQLVLPTLLGFTQGVAGVLSNVVVIVLLSIYWIIDQIHFERLWLSLLPSGQRKQARAIWRTIEHDLGIYIRSQILQSLLAGLLLGLGYWALGSPYPMLLALAGTLTCMIPVVGPVFAVISPLLLGLLTGVQLSIFTVLYTMIVLIVLGVWIKPRLFKRRWDNPILTLVMLMFMSHAFGLLGIIIAPPLSTVCQILWSLLVSRRVALGAAAQLSDLKERQERIWDVIRAMEEPPLALVTSSMERLSDLIEKAEPVLQTVDLAEASSGLLQLPHPVSTAGGQPDLPAAGKNRQ